MINFYEKFGNPRRNLEYLNLALVNITESDTIFLNRYCSKPFDMKKLDTATKSRDIWSEHDWIFEWCVRFYVAQNQNQRPIKRYFENIEFLRTVMEKSKRDSKITSFFLDKNYLIPVLEDPLNLFHMTRDAEISRLANDIKIEMGLLPQRKPEKEQRNIYSKRQALPIFEKDGDFFSIEICYYFPTYYDAKKIKEIISELKNDSLKYTLDRLHKRKRYSSMQIQYLQVKKAVYHAKTNELVITIGLKDAILALKESMQDELSRNSEMVEDSKCLYELRTSISKK